MCGWTATNNRDWDIESMKTIAFFSLSHFVGENLPKGKFLYTTVKRNRPSILSPVITNETHNLCLQFLYYVNRNKVALKVYIRYNNDDNSSAMVVQEIFHNVNRYGLGRMKANVRIPNQKEVFQIMIEFYNLHRKQTEIIALDDIEIAHCSKKELSSLRLTPNQQCQMYYGVSSSFTMKALGIDLHKNPSMICKTLPCYVGHDTTALIAAAPGTPCGHSKMCLKGNCEQHYFNPNASENCLYGDDPSFKYREVRCVDLNTSTENFCYMSNFRISCCYTCLKVYLPLIHNLKDLPGLNYTLDEQCTIMTGAPSVHCRDTSSNESSICFSLSCTFPGSQICENFIAASGTKCGNNMICISGHCEVNSLTSEQQYDISLNYISGIVLSVLVVSIFTTVYWAMSRRQKNYKTSKKEYVYEDIDFASNHVTSGQYSPQLIGIQQEEHYVYPGDGNEILPYNDPVVDVASNGPSDVYSDDRYVYPQGDGVIMPYSDCVHEVDYSNRRVIFVSSETVSKTVKQCLRNKLFVDESYSGLANTMESCLPLVYSQSVQEDYITPADFDYNKDDYITAVDVLYPPNDYITAIDVLYQQENYISPIDIIYPEEYYITPIDVIYPEVDYRKRVDVMNQHVDYITPTDVIYPEVDYITPTDALYPEVDYIKCIQKKNP
ncbi:hypothetical protein Btru_073810 [Bulinus truncatus]|nr:hypothetical protein Btru_073810 [Bulinus truncatus]